MNNLVSLDGKRVVVTGAGQGIGRAVAELSVELGARVAAVDLSADAVDEFAEGRKDSVLPFAGDVADPDLAPQVIAQMIDTWGE